ncbi:MAG: hypothetical protein ACI4SL_05520, partial [Candidatus Ornithospirochaeta sp.]
MVHKSVTFFGLISKLCKIRELYFVINDKYKGIPQPIIAKKIELAKLPEFSEIKIGFFSSKELEKVFESLDDEYIYDIIGYIPKQDMPLLEFNALQETVSYLMQMEIEENDEDRL